MAEAYAIGVSRDCLRCTCPFRDMRDAPVPGMENICSPCRSELTALETARFINRTNVRDVEAARAKIDTRRGSAKLLDALRVAHPPSER